MTASPYTCAKTRSALNARYADKLYAKCAHDSTGEVSESDSILPVEYFEKNFEQCRINNECVNQEMHSIESIARSSFDVRCAWARENSVRQFVLTVYNVKIMTPSTFWQKNFCLRCQEFTPLSGYSVSLGHPV